MLKLKNIRDKRHLANVRDLPCVICGNSETVPAHLRIGTDGGTSLKPSDCYVTPLCHAHHHEQHTVGERTFWGDIQKVKSLALNLYKYSDDKNKCLYFIQNFGR